MYQNRLHTALECSERYKLYSWWQRIPNTNYPLRKKIYFTYVVRAIILVQFIFVATCICCHWKSEKVVYVTCTSPMTIFRLLLFLLRQKHVDGSVWLCLWVVAGRCGSKAQTIDYNTQDINFSIWVVQRKQRKVSECSKQFVLAKLKLKTHF